MGFNIAIDGPAGAGKRTIAKLAASELSYIYVDTGAMYRAIGLYVYRKHVPEEDTNAIGETAKETEVSIRYIDGERHVYLNGEDVSEEIRKEHIGHMASVVGVHGNAGQANYAASKAGLIALAKSIGQEMGPKGIRANAIAPGFFITEQNRALLTNPDGTYTERGKDVIRQTPFGRMGKPEELCGTIQYLMSDAASFVTGTVAVVDGGFNIFAM